MGIITSIQEDFIKQFAKTGLRDIFFLTGGTALSAFYLQHRLSEDLDFFTEQEGLVATVLPIIKEIVIKLEASLEIRRNFRSYLEIFISRSEEILKCDFALDAPYRLKDKIFNEELGIYIDNVLDISCNKLSALFDRNDPKDFVDIYFITKDIFAFDYLLSEARKKHVGMDNYWLAISFFKVQDIAILPKMLKSISIEEVKTFFTDKAKLLMEEYNQKYNNS